MTYHFNTDDEREWLKAEGAEMNSIVEQLHKSGDEVFSTRKKSQLADLIAQQAARIAELERQHMVMHEEYRKYVFALDKISQLESDLSALRKRIEDAPVVAHITEDGKVFSNGFVRDTDKPLISKEDLQG